MKRLILVSVAAVLGAAVVAPAFADAPPVPLPGKHTDVALYVDTITSTRSVPKPTVGCTQSSLFAQGQRVVFRMWGVESATGDPLTPDNVKYAYVKIPGSPNIAFTFAKHGSLDTSPSFYSAVWPIPIDYALGQVAYKVVVKTKHNKFGIFDPTVLAPTSRLTVTPHP